MFRKTNRRDSSADRPTAASRADPARTDRQRTRSCCPGRRVSPARWLSCCSSATSARGSRSGATAVAIDHSESPACTVTTTAGAGRAPRRRPRRPAADSQANHDQRARRPPRPRRSAATPRRVSRRRDRRAGSAARPAPPSATGRMRRPASIRRRPPACAPTNWCRQRSRSMTPAPRAAAAGAAGPAAAVRGRPSGRQPRVGYGRSDAATESQRPRTGRRRDVDLRRKLGCDRHRDLLHRP